MEDHDFDELVAALKLVGVFLTKGKPEDLKALLAGEASLGVIPKGWKPMPPGSRLPSTTTKLPKVEVPPASRIRALLLDASSEEAQRALLHDIGMNATQARQLAKDLGVPRAGRSSIEQAIDKIIEYFRGSAAGDTNERQRY